MNIRFKRFKIGSFFSKLIETSERLSDSEMYIFLHLKRFDYYLPISLYDLRRVSSGDCEAINSFDNKEYRLNLQELFDIAVQNIDIEVHQKINTKEKQKNALDTILETLTTPQSTVDPIEDRFIYERNINSKLSENVERIAVFKLRKAQILMFVLLEKNEDIDKFLKNEKVILKEIYPIESGLKLYGDSKESSIKWISAS